MKPLQAVVASTMLRTLDERLARRREIQGELDTAFSEFEPRVVVPRREPCNPETVSLYMVLVERRDELIGHLAENGVEAKVHYPIPLHLQHAATKLKLRPSSMPIAEAQANSLVTLPSHEYLSNAQIKWMIEVVRQWVYAGG